jgi:hypothetical protein
MDIKETITLFLEKNVPTDPSKWQYYVSQAKKKFDVYPSAYANGWAAKQYKDAGGKWKTEEGEEPQHVAQGLPQTKELKGKLIGEKLVKYFAEIGLKHACYQNENGEVKVIGLNKDQVKEAIERVVQEYKNMKEGMPGGVGVGLAFPNGTINGSPSEDDVEKMKDKLGRDESVEGDRIQNLNNRIKALQQKLSATKSSEQKKLFQDRIKNALQTLSNYKKGYGIKAPHTESVNEIEIPKGFQVLKVLNDIVKTHSAEKVKDQKTGKVIMVDVQSANVVLKVYDALSTANKAKFLDSGLNAMIKVSWQIMGKR